MAGFDAPYVPGWDCHGLPIEIKVDKELGGKKLQMRPTDVRAECRKYAQKFLDLQRQQFKRIGVFGRFRPALRHDESAVRVGCAVDFFFVLRERLRLQRPARVYWCMHDETALAEAEVEYENHTSRRSG
jgi:isoleucyl-tRNA synthetase